MDELQKRWEVAWARGEELDEEQARLIAAMTSMEPAMFDRALAVLQAQRKELHAELEAIQAALHEREESAGREG